MSAWGVFVTSHKVDIRPRCGGLFGPVGVFVCLTLQSCGTQREHFVSAWRVFVTFHIGEGEKFLVLYKYKLFLTL